MIRRTFWMGLGAVLGVSGYRRAAAVARSLSPRPARPVSPSRQARPAASHPASPPTRAREAARFVRDVREGMEEYLERHHHRPPNTLQGQALARRPAAGGRAGVEPQEPGAARAGRPDLAGGRERPGRAGPDHAEDGR